MLNTPYVNIQMSSLNFDALLKCVFHSTTRKCMDTGWNRYPDNLAFCWKTTFTAPQKKKFHGDKFGERGDHQCFHVAVETIILWTTLVELHNEVVYILHDAASETCEGFVQKRVIPILHCHWYGTTLSRFYSLLLVIC